MLFRASEDKEDEGKFNFIINTEEPKLLQSLAIDDFFVKYIVYDHFKMI